MMPGVPTEEALCDHASPVQVLILSYETFRLHEERFRGDNVCDLLICDEAHRLKNDQTLTNKVSFQSCLLCTMPIPSGFPAHVMSSLVLSLIMIPIGSSSDACLCRPWTICSARGGCSCLAHPCRIT